jgi:divalent metal cation (Fe/Co/Zn/Cd) transporter
MMLVIGLPLALRQYLAGKTYDALSSLFVFIGFFVIAGFDISWEILMPVLFLIAALYILLREFFNPASHTTAEEEESLSYEIEESEKK